MRGVERVGKVQTVLGLINADNLGVTLPHEHLLTDLSTYFVEPAEAGLAVKKAKELLGVEYFWVRNA